jgi:hypothetical protein
MKKLSATKINLKKIVQNLALIAISLGYGGSAVRAQDDTQRPSPVSDLQWNLLLSQAAEGFSDSIVIKNYAVGSSHLIRLDVVGELRELILDGGVVDDSDLAVIVRNCPKLEHLRLRHSPISDSGAKILAEMKKLRIVNLPQSVLTAQGLKLLKSLENLEQLRLGGPQLDDQATVVIAQFPALRSLHLIRPSLSDQALRNLAKSPRLSSLYIDGCDLSSEAWQEISLKKPGLHIHLDQKHSD